jgi:hypothetical protein
MDNQQSTQATLGTVSPFPAIAPGYRLAPVAIGAPGPKQCIVYAECADFCTESHVANFVYFLDDISHNGDAFTISVPSFLIPDAAVFQWSVRVSSDPTATDPQMRDAHVVLEGDTGIDAYHTADMANATASDLRKLADKLDEAARTARLHNQHQATQAVTA